MANEENEKIPLCPVCLETLTTKIDFASDGYLYDENCFSKLDFENPISRQDFLYSLKNCKQSG